MRKTFALLVLVFVVMLTNCAYENDAEEYADFEINEELTALYDFVNDGSNTEKVIVVNALGGNNYEVNAVDGIENNMPLIKTRSEAVDDSWTYYGEIDMSVSEFKKAWEAMEKIYGSAPFKIRIEPVEGSDKRKVYHKAA